MKQVLLSLIVALSVSLSVYSQNDTIKAFYKGEDYLQLIKLDYPQYAVEMEIFGEVNFKFHIDKVGCLDSIVIISSPHDVLSKEVKRSLSTLKCDWTPHNSWICDRFNFRMH